MQQISRWLNLTTYGLGAVVAALYGTIFFLHSRGRWKGFRGAWPPQKFWATFPRQYSGWIALGLAVLTIVLAAEFVSMVNEMRQPADLREAMQRVTRSLDDFEAAVYGTVAESHRRAVGQRKRGLWRQWIIDDFRKDPPMLLELYGKIDDPLTKVDLLYCLQEITGVDLGLKPDQDMSPDALAAKFATLRRKYKPPKPKSPATGHSAAKTSD